MMLIRASVTLIRASVMLIRASATFIGALAMLIRDSRFRRPAPYLGQLDRG
ncbi:hypothetical protein ABZU53_31425 [Micromonospora sp. NPDC005194]|uniref:hypothetical protein n=1 Tax=Micromonospora sp. NPDC005194 TaxID=3156870 RepID=UPI0033A2E08C